MCRIKTVCVLLCVVLCYFEAQGADKYTDENRPYEFGFTIDGEQHRHEKKDENGIIMGEFGFITADGVYHVTVYATDENGNFKIISIKNIRVKPYPTAPDTGGRQGHSLSFSPTKQASTPQTTTKNKQIKQEISSSIKACSGCKIPTTTTTTTPQPNLASPVVVNKNNNYNNQFPATGNSQTLTQNNNNQQAFRQTENSFIQQQSSQPNLNQPNPNYQQGSISSQQQQNVPLPQNYPNQGVGQENNVQNVLNQQNYQQDEFNVGRKYLQKSQQTYQQKPSIGPNSLIPSSVGSNIQQGFNVEQQQKQGIIDGQYHLQPPYEAINDQRTSNPSQSYPQQSNTNVQNSGQNYQANAALNHAQVSNTNGNNYVQNKVNLNEPEIISQPKGDRQPKTFMDILQRVNPEQEYKSIATPTSPTAIQQNTGKPVLVAAQMQVVNKNTDVYHRNEGEKEGLPAGVTKGDLTDLLYTFNYTVGFHGHHEEGYRSGAKIGYYYVTARNGVKTRVDYVADEKGFHPRISQETLDIQSDEVPKPETEKEAKYGLKGYEFKWLYYPVDSK
ncbi:putative uncharacterized protein DDB_G0271606 [Bicyclus anynana]|uniref:Uncharacterized protein n=1 Tax=Bicyclus anynana TaxID=110368 RepID=A0A6J1NTQ7_BICAN|nr:putative uncharacterized protein DDB_G0271606 [Bicyclus anynana]